MIVVVCVVEEVGCEVGKEVGYFIWFEDVILVLIKIKFFIDGFFIREVLVDLLLSCYLVIMVDEVYECFISIDILFGFFKKIWRKWLDLRIIISSVIF